MSSTKTVEVVRVVAAPVEDVFAVVADPRRHVAMDGSGTLRGTDSGPITHVGQVFLVNMYRDDLGGYRTVNTVTEFEPGTSLGWAPTLDRSHPCGLVEMLADITTGGHTFTYRLREVPDGTEVTQVYDWTGVGDPRFEAFCPFVSEEELADTLEKLAGVVEKGGRST
jgi:uncharacterized protein YndB with AHSA1/START domain